MNARRCELLDQLFSNYLSVESKYSGVPTSDMIIFGGHRLKSLGTLVVEYVNTIITYTTGVVEFFSLLLYIDIEIMSVRSSLF